MAKAGWSRPDNARVVVLLAKDELERIDRLGMEAGLPSRSATVRKLIEDGIRAAIQPGAAEAH